MADCTTCKDNRQKVEPIPFFVHEADMARMERTIKRLWIALLVIIVLLVATNAAWLWYESQFEEVSVAQEVETGNGDATVIGVGDINYGESPTDSND